jgi:hypothetical protein
MGETFVSPLQIIGSLRRSDARRSDRFVCTKLCVTFSAFTAYGPVGRFDTGAETGPFEQVQDMESCAVEGVEGILVEESGKVE